MGRGSLAKVRSKNERIRKKKERDKRKNAERQAARSGTSG